MTQKKVVIIDDDHMTCNLIETFLQLDDYRTASVNSIDPTGIIPILERENPDIIFLDFHLGSNETLQYVTTIRQDATWQNLPIIMTSAIDYGKICRDAGANDFIVKPFNWEEVTQHIHVLLDNSPDQMVHSRRTPSNND